LSLVDTAQKILNESTAFGALSIFSLSVIGWLLRERKQLLSDVSKSRKAFVDQLIEQARIEHDVNTRLSSQLMSFKLIKASLEERKWLENASKK
jgi:hypothetical protein